MTNRHITDMLDSTFYMTRLFKYYSPSENSFKSLAVKGLWCHRAENMNDPFDCLGLVKRKFNSEQLHQFKEIISRRGTEKLKSWLKLDNIELEKVINEHRSHSIQKYAFSALSEQPDVILMWSHYAQAHTGFVIELEFPELENDHHLQKVDYQPSLPEFDLIKFANFMTGDDNLINYLFQDISVKSPDWSYESEWRIWRKNPSYYYYKPEQVKGIYFGINTKDDVKQTVFELTSYIPEESSIYYTMEFNDNPVKLKY